MPVIPAVGLGGAGGPVNDAYGAAFTTGTQGIVRPIPQFGVAGVRTKLTGFAALPGTTQATVTILQAQGSSPVAFDVAASAVTIPVNLMPNKSALGVSGAFGNGDWIIVQYQDGSWDAMQITSVAGNTMTVKSGNSAAKVIKAGSTVWMMGTAGDFPSRQFYVPTTTLPFIFSGGMQTVLGVARNDNEPLLVYYDNSGGGGCLLWTAFGYGTA